MTTAFLLFLQSLTGTGYQHFAKGDVAAARKVLEQAVAQQPKSFQARLLLGATLVELGDAQSAIPHLKQAHLLNPTHGDVRKLLAAQYAATRQYREAAALVDPPTDEETHLLLIEARHRSGNAPRAFAIARQAAVKFPKSAQIAAWLGFQLQFAGRYDEAKAELRRAIALDAAQPLPYQVMGDVFLKEERYAEAVAWLRQAVEKMPGDVEVILSLSRALAESGGLAQAITLLEKVPGDARVHLQLSRLYFRSGDEARAREEAARAIQMREGRP